MEILEIVEQKNKDMALLDYKTKVDTLLELHRRITNSEMEAIEHTLVTCSVALAHAQDMPMDGYYERVRKEETLFWIRCLNYTQEKRTVLINK